MHYITPRVPLGSTEGAFCIVLTTLNKQKKRSREEDLIVANIRIWHDTLIDWLNKQAYICPVGNVCPVAWSKPTDVPDWCLLRECACTHMYSHIHTRTHRHTQIHSGAHTHILTYTRAFIHRQTYTHNCNYYTQHTYRDANCSFFAVFSTFFKLQILVILSKMPQNTFFFQGSLCVHFYGTPPPPPPILSWYKIAQYS